MAPRFEIDGSVNGFRIIHSNPTPPIPEVTAATFDLIYAYSVFSHLSEAYSQAWLDYLLTLLKPGSHLVFTTRGDRFINDLVSIRAQSEETIEASGVAGWYLRQLREHFPDPDTIRQRFLAWEFQFYPVGHTELPEKCTGETLIPQGYLEARYKSSFVSFDADVPAFGQSAAVLRQAR